MSVGVERHITTPRNAPLPLERSSSAPKQQEGDSIQASPEYTLLLERFNTREEPYHGILIRQGIERANLAIDVIELIKSPDTKEKMLRQADANAITDPMILRVISGLIVPSHDDVQTDHTKNYPPTAWSDLDILRDAKNIDVEKLRYPPEDVLATDEDILQVEADAFESGFELVLRRYEEKLMKGLQGKVLFIKHNS